MGSHVFINWLFKFKFKNCVYAFELFQRKFYVPVDFIIHNPPNHSRVNYSKSPDNSKKCLACFKLAISLRRHKKCKIKQTLHSFTFFRLLTTTSLQT